MSPEKLRHGKWQCKLLDAIGFEIFCRQIFTECDIDKSGTVDVTEVQVMVLLLYVRINKFTAGRCVPPSRKEIEAMVRFADIDERGNLDVEEFIVLAHVLCEAVATRVLVQI